MGASEDSDHSKGRGFTRRAALGGASALGAGVVLGRYSSSYPDDSGSGPERRNPIEFYGEHQAGIATPAQEALNFAAFDLAVDSQAELRDLLRAWTLAAARLTRGEPYGQPFGEPELPPSDTGEAFGLGPAGLTLTFGFGPQLFTRRTSLGISGKLPPALSPLPAFRGEQLDQDRSHGDLCIQACAEDAQVAFHAIHVLSRIGAGVATLRWQQLGFGRTSSTSRDQETPRNLMGFKDGTANIRSEETGAMDDFVWVQPGDGPAWMTGGSYLVARRIQILFDVWDATSLEGQERVIGRHKASGAPLGRRDEYDALDLDASQDGARVIPANAHVRLASPQSNQGQRLLRRGYSYAEPPEPDSGQIDAGLFFVCFQRDPRQQFVPIQRRLAASDALNHHTLHTASALFACPPAVNKGGFVGEGLFA